LVLAAVGCGSSAAATTTIQLVAPPAARGYFNLVPVGHFSTLPRDAAAAAKVHRSAWEPRSANATANHTVAPSTFKVAGYSGMVNHAKVFGRVTGNYRGTTDEIIQWAAVKWGLPDNVIRAEAVAESAWYQNLHRGRQPVADHGYGDFGVCGGSPPASGYGAQGPSSFGVMQVKWCTMKDANAPGYGPWPWVERSTAYDLDFYAAVIRGCFEGWDTWLGATYHRGDLWGCVGRWFSGAWHDPAAERYIVKVKSAYTHRPWLTWRG
jgi:hypothetical protein